MFATAHLTIISIHLRLSSNENAQFLSYIMLFCSFQRYDIRKKKTAAVLTQCVWLSSKALEGICVTHTIWIEFIFGKKPCEQLLAAKRRKNLKSEHNTQPWSWLTPMALKVSIKLSTQTISWGGNLCSPLRSKGVGTERLINTILIVLRCRKIIDFKLSSTTAARIANKVFSGMEGKRKSRVTNWRR